MPSSTRLCNSPALLPGAVTVSGTQVRGITSLRGDVPAAADGSNIGRGARRFPTTWAVTASSARARGVAPLRGDGATSAGEFNIGLGLRAVPTPWAVIASSARSQGLAPLRGDGPDSADGSNLGRGPRAGSDNLGGHCIERAGAGPCAPYGVTLRAPPAKGLTLLRGAPSRPS